MKIHYLQPKIQCYIPTIQHKDKELSNEEKQIKQLAKILVRIYLNNPTYQQEKDAQT